MRSFSNTVNSKLSGADNQHGNSFTQKGRQSASDNQQDEVQRAFHTWVEQNGIECNLLKISVFDGLRGLAAAEELFPGQVVIT